jgi:O-antigen/teichoic acid export membrane protein
LTDQWLPAEHGTDNRDLGGKVARGLLWTIVDNWGRQLLGLAVFVVLANLLTDVDFGLVALATVFVAFAQIFVDQGLSDAVVQRRVLERAHIDSAFWVSMTMGGLLAVAGVLLAYPIAAVLGEPRLVPILQVLSLSFVLTALSSVQMALLRREMAFRSLALRALFAISGGGVVGIAMAFMGFGAWALVGQQLAQAGLSVAALWRVSPWRPGRGISGRHFRELFGFSRNVVGSDVLTFLSRNTDNLLIGVVLGLAPLGLYAVAYRLLDSTGSILIGISRKLAFPTFSRLQHDRERMTRAYFRVSRASGVIIVPGYIGMALIAPELTPVLFGEQWQASGPVAAVLFLVGPVAGLQTFGFALLNAAGHPGVVFRFRLVTTVGNVIGFALAVPFGILAVAAAFTLRGYLLFPLHAYWVRRYAGVAPLDYVAQLRGLFIATGLMAAVLVGLRLALGPEVSRVLLLASSVVLGAASFMIAMLLVDRQLLWDLVGFGRQALPSAGRQGRGGRRRRPSGGAEPAPGAGEGND